ncbi:hypothetical protein CFPU101_18930 [Chroococcus sp. FPU101]|nr:hypothetical protein CFPU101_18930 [Chroococcus sp. FPU101]
MSSVQEAKDRLDTIIKKARVDFYKPIQIAEVLRRSRLHNDIDILNKETYQNKSIRWSDEITKRLIGKVSTSSARYQHDVWNTTEMPPELLEILDRENQRTQGVVERYIYFKFSERQKTIPYIDNTSYNQFELSDLLKLFRVNSGIKRSIDKAYEIITDSLFETLVIALDNKITISIPIDKQDLLNEFSDLAKVLLGLQKGQNSWEFAAHIYRVGVTNAADRGLDM